MVHLDDTIPLTLSIEAELGSNVCDASVLLFPVHQFHSVCLCPATLRAHICCTLAVRVVYCGAGVGAARVRSNHSVILLPVANGEFLRTSFKRIRFETALAFLNVLVYIPKVPWSPTRHGPGGLSAFLGIAG